MRSQLKQKITLLECIAYWVFPLSSKVHNVLSNPGLHLFIFDLFFLQSKNEYT